MDLLGVASSVEAEIEFLAFMSINDTGIGMLFFNEAFVFNLTWKV
jgi:hypothetical protein